MKQLGLFAKYWEPGRVKTRLAESIGEQAASRLHREFLASSLATFQSFPAERVLAYWPPDKQPEFAKLAIRASMLAAKAEALSKKPLRQAPKKELALEQLTKASERPKSR